MFRIKNIETSCTGETSSRTRIIIEGGSQPANFDWCWEGDLDRPSYDGQVYPWERSNSESLKGFFLYGCRIKMTIDEMRVNCGDFPPTMFRTNATWGSGYGGDIVVLSKNGNEIFVHDRWAARLDRWDFVSKNLEMAPDGKLFIP